MSIKVERKEGESFNRLWNRFRRSVKDSDVLHEYKERKTYTKPSKQRRDERHQAIRREENRKKHKWK